MALPGLVGCRVYGRQPWSMSAMTIVIWPRWSCRGWVRSRRRRMCGIRSGWSTPTAMPVAAVAVFLKDLQATGRSVGDAAVVCDGSVAVVPVRVGGRRAVGSGDPGRGPGFLPLAGVACQAGPRSGAVAVRSGGTPNPVTGRPGPGRAVCGGDAGAFGDGAAGVLRLPPRRGDRADGQSVPVVAGAPGWPGERASQPDGAVPGRAGGVVSAAGAGGFRGASRTRCSTGCSPSSARTGTGRWSRCGCRPAARASELLGCVAVTSIRGSSWSR